MGCSMPARSAVVLVLLSCASSTPTPGPEDASAPVQGPSTYSEPEGHAYAPRGSCIRSDTLSFDGGAWHVRLPCRPFDRLKDTPDPQP